MNKLPEGFNGDTYLQTKIKQLIVSEKVEHIIETGTYLGQTTVEFLKMLPSVWTIEISKTYHRKALVRIRQELANQPKAKFKAFLGSSPRILSTQLSQVQSKKLLFFLDAHWNGTPLLEELTEIANANLTQPPVIVIHDFKVPDKNFGYDTYNGQPYTWEWIEEYVNKIYLPFEGRNPTSNFTYTREYNTVAVGAERGVVFIY